MKKSLSSQGLSIPNAILFLISIGMITVSIYLTKHFFEANFPASILDGGSSLCSFNTFFNCDSASFSPIAHFFGVPTGTFGIVIGICLLLSLFISSERLESHTKLLLLANAIGCVFFLMYSVFKMGSICPFCSIYYVLSWSAFGIFYFYSSLNFNLNPIHFLWQIVLLFTLGWPLSNNYYATKALHSKASENVIKEYESLADLGKPEINSNFYIHKSTNTAKVFISIFSDFQCPFCKKISEQMHEISRRFKDSVEINYYFFPLDGNCNSEVKNTIHPFACMAAEVASCDQNKFLEIHNKIFENQDDLSDNYLEQLKKDFNLNQCPTHENFIKLIQEHVNVAKSYNVKSTPTFILNGKKIEGVVPTNHLSAVIQSLIKKQK